MDSIFKGKCKTVVTLLSCLVLLIQFATNAFAGVPQVHKANNTKDEEVTPYTTKCDEIDALSSMQGIDNNTEISVKEYQLGNTYGNPYIELSTINNDKVTKSSEIELSFRDIPDNSIVTKAILKLAKKSGTDDFIWYLSDNTAWYLGNDVADGQIIEIDVTPSVKAAIEQGFDTISLELAPYIQEDNVENKEESANRTAASNGYVEFDSASSSLVLNYTSADTYRDHSAVISLGTGQSVDLYTGEMSFSVVEASTSSPAFPVSICHNYSSFFGWIMNYDQSVFVPTNPTYDWALYSDGYGKVHYFTFIDGVLTDSGGLGLIFSYIPDGYQITDKVGNVLEFDEDGNLVKVMDRSGNYAAITRNYYGRISYVTDSFGRSFHFLYNLNTGKMVSVSDPSGRYTSFSYTGDDLTAISYPDGMSISFQYSDGKVSKIINPDGTKTSFSYGNNKLCRVNIIPSDSNTTADYVQITYKSNSTTEVRDRTGLAQVYKLDGNGRVTCEYEKLYDEYLHPVRNYLTGTVLFSYTDTKRTFSSSIAAEGDNCIENGDFSGNSESPWVFYGDKSLYDGMYDGEYVINGSPNKVKYIGQTIDEEDIEVPYGNTMIFSAWAKASSASTGTFRIKAEVWYTDNSHTDSETSFDKNFTDWQYAATPIKIDRDLTIDHVNVFLEYSNNGGTCYFDDVRLVCAPAAESEYESDLAEFLTVFGTSRTINERVTATDGIYTTVIEKNENGDVIRQTITDLNGNDFVSLYEYDSCRRLVKTQDYRNMITEYTYNSVGMVTSTKTYYCYIFNPAYDPAPEEYFLSTTEYDQTGEFAVGVGDSRSDSIQTVNVFNTTKGLLTSTTSPNGQTTSYSYDSDNDLVTAVTSTLGNDVFSVLYGYDSARRVTSVTHNGFVYGFTYDSLGREEEFSIAGTTFYDNSYELTDKTTVTTEYTSGESVVVETDSINRTVKNTYTDSDDEDTVISEVEYDEFGNPVTLIDNLTDIEYTYKYDAYGNAVWEKRDGDMYKHSTFDSHCRLTSTSKENETYTLIYDSKAGVIYPDSTVVGMTLSGKYTDRIRLDHYGRTVAGEVTLASAQAPLIKGEITYISVEDGDEMRLTQYPETFRILVNGTEVSKYSYTYDDNGNITEVSSSGNLIIRYVYDGMDRLIREDNSILNASFTYSYDTAGNILEKDKYPYSISTLGTATETKLYTYASTGWKDKMISFDGVSITYDVLGNPTSYRGHTLSWGKIRQLEAYDQNSFEYNASGIRVRKNGTVYELDSTTIVEERRTGTVIRYHYGVEGLIGFTLNGTDYYYTKDLLGNITGIYGADGTQYAAYEYDAWGNHTVTLDVNGIGTLNPFRYRGYYYDVETGLYYLQTRYYDPVVGRFINADSLFSGKPSFSMNNLYTYCRNNPVMFLDNQGTEEEGVLTQVDKLAVFVLACGMCVSTMFLTEIAKQGRTLTLPSLPKSKLSTTVDILYDPNLRQNILESLRDELKIAIEKVVNNVYVHKTEKHHIIARTATLAKPARDIWKIDLGNRIDDPRNLVMLSTCFHKILHTSSYYVAVNLIITVAYLTSNNPSEAVDEALKEISAFLVTTNALLDPNYKP